MPIVIMLTVLITLTLVWMWKMTKYLDTSHELTHHHIYKCIECKYKVQFDIPNTLEPRQMLNDLVLELSDLVDKYENHTFTLRTLKELQAYHKRIHSFLIIRKWIE